MAGLSTAGSSSPEGRYPISARVCFARSKSAGEIRKSRSEKLRRPRQLRVGQRAQELESVFRLQRSARHGRRRQEFAQGNPAPKGASMLGPLAACPKACPDTNLTRTTGEASGHKPESKPWQNWNAKRHYNTESSTRVRSAVRSFVIHSRRPHFRVPLSWTKSFSNPSARYFAIVQLCSIGLDGSGAAQPLP